MQPAKYLPLSQESCHAASLHCTVTFHFMQFSLLRKSLHSRSKTAIDYQSYKFKSVLVTLHRTSFSSCFMVGANFWWTQEETTHPDSSIQAVCLMLCDQLRHTAVRFPSCLCHFSASDNSCSLDGTHYSCTVSELLISPRRLNHHPVY